MAGLLGHTKEGDYEEWETTKEKIKLRESQRTIGETDKLRLYKEKANSNLFSLDLCICWRNTPIFTFADKQKMTNYITELISELSAVKEALNKS